jgi:hypothetical protein
MSDLRLVLDLLLARLAWLAGEELVVKPFLRRKYNRLDQSLNDRPPDLE